MTRDISIPSEECDDRATLAARQGHRLGELLAAIHGRNRFYTRKLDEAGVKVTTVRYDGMIHDFGLLNGLAEEPAVRSLFGHAAAELKKHLQREGDKRTVSA